MNNGWGFAGYVEDWLPIGRGGQRRLFKAVDEYNRAHTEWVRMTRHEKEDHLRGRENAEIAQFPARIP